MYRNLNATSLGLNVRQNELIELALTHKFTGFDMTLDALAKQVELRGPDDVTRYTRSANIRVGTISLSSDWYGSEEQFATEWQRLEKVVPVAESLGAPRWIAHVAPYNDLPAYHETFGLHVERVNKIAQLLKNHGLRLGLSFLAPARHREGHASQFIATADGLLAMLKMINDDHVGLGLDTWHWWLGGGTLDSLRSLPPQKIMSVRLADLPADFDPATTTEEQRLLPGSTDIIPTEKILQWLMVGQYDGPVTVYGHPSQFTSAKRYQAVEWASNALNKLMTRAAGEGVVESTPSGVALN